MASPGEIDQLFWSLGANTAPLVAGVGRAKQSIAGLAKNVLSLRGGLIAIGTVGALAFLKATTAAAKLDKPLREVSTLIPQTVEDMGELRKEIIALSTRVPQPPEQLTKGLYQVISAGVTDTAEAMDLLEVAATAATAGLSTSQDAVLAITTVLNAYQLSASESARISDIFFKTIAQGVITFPEIASTIGDMATTAAQAGVSVEEMSAALASMTKAGISAAEATTALNKLFLLLITGEIGEGFDLAAIQADGFAGVMNRLEEVTRGDIKALQALVPEVRAFRAAAVLAGNQNAEFNNILNEVQDSAGATTIAFDKMNESLQAQSTLLQNRVNAFFLELGVVTLPIVILAVKTLNRVLGATDFEAPAAGAEALAAQIDTVKQSINDLRGNLVRLEIRTSAQRVAGLGLQPGDLEGVTEVNKELERMIALRTRLIEEQTRRRAAAPPVAPVGGGAEQISDDIQALRDQLATQLQDELVAITTSAVDDMELEFMRLKDTIIRAFGEVPDEWKAVLDEMRAEIERTGLDEEIDFALAKLISDLGKFRRFAGGVSAPIEDLEGDVDELADSVLFLTRTFAELGQGFGVFGRDAASALNSIATVGEGVQGLLAAVAGGASILGPVGAIAGGLASLAGLVFGPDPREIERLRILKENNEALDRLSRTLTASETKAATPDPFIGAVSNIVDLIISGQAVAAHEALQAAGLSFSDLAAFALEFGITLDGTREAWAAFDEALTTTLEADVFEGFAGAMERMRIEWELLDTVDPIKKLEAARKKWLELTGITAPKNADEVIALWRAITSGDLTGIGELSPSDAITLLQLIEGLLDEADRAEGTTTSFAVSRTITEVTGNRLAGLLTTDVFWNEQTALNTAGILNALGGTRGGLAPPAAVAMLGNTDVTIMVNGAGDPTATAVAVRDEFVGNMDRILGERLRDTRRAQGRQQTEAFRS